MKNNILIITGGTGGHVIPAVNFYKYIDYNKREVYLLTDIRGSKYINDIDKKKVYRIHSSHLSGNIFFKLRGITKLFFGFLQSVIIFIKLKPKIIISFGSYASFSPLLCFVFLKFFFKTKLYLHEQNSVVGQTNRVFIKYSNKIFMHFDKEYKNIVKYSDKVLVTGMPEKIFENHLYYDFKKDNKNLIFLVFAGSQGSIDILNLFKKIIYELKKILNLKKIKFIIQSPIHKQQEIKNLLIQNHFDFEVKEFFENFQYILSKANIALCRSGAGTINDLIKYKIPAIISPLPSAKDNHQYENAKILIDTECAIIVNRKKTNIDEIISFIDKVVNDKNFNKSLLYKLSKIKNYNSSELMWKLIEDDQKK